MVQHIKISLPVNFCKEKLTIVFANDKSIPDKDFRNNFPQKIIPIKYQVTKKSLSDEKKVKRIMKIS